MGIEVLGPLTAGGNGQLSPRDRVVLSALVVRNGSATSAEELADALWGDEPPASWHKVVPGCVNRLRKALGADAIVTTSTGYRLELIEEEVDLHRFERLVAKGNQMLALGEPDRAVLALREALSLWRGPALRDVEEWPPARAEIERLEELRLGTEEAVVDASLRVGLQAGILAEARSRVAQAPVRERRWALLALAQYLSGSQADALATLRRAREMLSRELGLDPGSELIELEQAMLRQDPSLSAATALPRPVARCPYPGLLPYDVDDADFFFGRAADLVACRRRLAETGVLVLVGPSGNGKSSLLRAGLAASLAHEGAQSVIVPTGATEDDLLTEIEQGDSRTVLVLDQVEEVVARLSSPAQRARLADALAACAGRRRLVMAVRADRFGDLAELPGFASLAERGLVLLGPLGEEALREAIEGPAREGALLLEPGLVDVLLQDVRDDPGALPLLSHALRETWERREGRTLTVEGYRDSGGIRGAVARTAEQVYDDVPEGDRAKLRVLMLRLLTLAPDGEPLRSAVSRGAIPEDAAHEHLVERLVQARLVTADADVLDLAHETLARAWPRLRGWLDDDLEGQRILRHLSTAAESWHAMGRPDAELYRGDRLVRATAWHAASRADLTVHETHFLTRSSEVAEAAAAEAERMASARRRNRRRAEVLVAVAATLAVVAGLAAWAALRERDRASGERLVASARRAASLSYAEEDPARSLLLAVEAVHRDDSPDTRRALLAALSRSPELVRVVPGDGGALDASHDGTRLFITSDGIRAVDTASFEVNAEADVFAQVVAEPGRTVSDSYAEAEDDTEGRVYVESRDGEMRPIPLPDLNGWERLTVTAHLAAGRIAAVFERATPANKLVSRVAAWDIERPADLLVDVKVLGTTAAGGVHNFAIDPDGDRLYVATSSARAWLRAYDVDSGELLAALPAPGVTAPGELPGDRTRTFIRVSHDGSALAANDGADVVLVDPETMAVTARLRGHTHQVIATEFSENDRLVAASARDGTTLVWDRESGGIVEQLEGIRMPVESLAFSPDSTTLYGSTEAGVLVWDLDGGRRFVSTLNRPGVGRLSYLPVVAPDGRSAAFFRLAATEFGQDTGFDLMTSDGLHLNVPTELRNWGSYSPSGDLLVTVSKRTLQVWDPRNGNLVDQTRLPGIADAEAATFTADGSLIVVGDADATIRAVDADTLEAVGEPVSLDLPLNDIVSAGKGTGVVVLIARRPDGDERPWPTYVEVDPASGSVQEGPLHGDSENRFGYGAASPDGKRLAVTLPGGRAGLLDLEAGSWLLKPTKAHDLTTRVDFNSDGTRFVTSGLDGRVILWDGLTGERLADVQPLGPDFEAGVAFMPDGHTVTIAASNGQLFRWDTKPAGWLDYACSVAGRNLDEEEWRSVFESEPYRDTCPQPESG